MPGRNAFAVPGRPGRWPQHSHCGNQMVDRSCNGLCVWSRPACWVSPLVWRRLIARMMRSVPAVNMSLLKEGRAESGDLRPLHCWYAHLRFSHCCPANVSSFGHEVRLSVVCPLVRSRIVRLRHRATLDVLAQVPRVCRALEDSWPKCRDPTAVVLGLEEDLLECHERLRR